MSDDILLLDFCWYLFALVYHIVAVGSARHFWSALDFNGAIAVRLFILYHGKHIKDIGYCRRRTASAFECVLRGATGDVVVVGRTVVSEGGKGVDDSTRRRRRDGD